MPSSVQASVADVLDAGLVRLSELGAELVYLRENHQPTRQVALSIIDLRQKLEALALTSSGAERATLMGYVQETYGLLAVYTDPVRRPLLPDLSAGGSQLVPLVLSANGFNLLVNGKYIRMGYVLVPTQGAPTYTTTLLPGGSVPGYAYSGEANTELAITPNTGASTPQPYTVFLWLGGQQVGRVDYPSVAVGDGFRLLYKGVAYYGTFPSATNQILPL